MPDTILIAELFGPVLQGEGALAGQVSHFVRTSGCPYRCTWCDSMHAVDPDQIAAKSRKMTQGEIYEAVVALPRSASVPWVTLSGGDPVAWDLKELVKRLHGVSYTVAVETQGSLWNDWLTECDLITCSPKPPSSGMRERLDMDVLGRYERWVGRRMVLKVVAFDERDLDFAEWLHQEFHRLPMYITAGTPPRSPGWEQGIPGVGDDEPIQSRVLHSFRTISESVLRRPALHDVTVGVQQHVLLWGRELER